MYKVSDGIDEKTKEIKDYSTADTVQYKNGYDINQNHTANTYESLGNGDFYTTKQEAQAHNDKVRDTGLPYAPINDFTWSNPYGYAMEKKLNEINDYTKKGFKYTPEEDAVYQSLDKRYKSQALDNYNDSITSLARQYGGEIPAYLKQIAKNNYMTEAGKANDAIPTLSQMAWDMWGDTRNDMYNQYNLLANENAQDYMRFRDNLNWIIDSQNNMYNRKVTDRQMDQTDRQYELDKEKHNLSLSEYYDNKNKTIGDTLFGLKDRYIGLGYSEQQADEMAKKEYAQLYGGYIPSAVSSGGLLGNNPIGGAVPGKGTTETVIEDEKDAEKATIYIDEDGNIKVRD